MIASVRGLVTALAPDAAVVEVGGVGLSVQCAPSTLARLRVGEPARLATSLVVRDDSLTLYGFADDDERAVFELLQTASGVGPRLAQAMLAVHPPAALRRAVATEDLAALTLVPGIGKKGAQRIVLELKDRLLAGGPQEEAVSPGSSGPGPSGSASAAAAATPWRQQLATALTGLGWSAREAEAAIAEVSAEAADANGPDGVPDVAALLKSALRRLAPR